MIASGLERKGAIVAGREAVSLRVTPALAGLLALFVLGLALRSAELDRIPLGEGEARQALAALDLLTPQRAVGSPAVESPLLLAAQTLLFSLFGSSEVTARLPLVIAGALLPLAPLALRDVLGQGRSMVLCLLMATSPILLMASRESAAVVLSLLLFVGVLWGAQRYRRTGEQTAATCATAFTLALLLLAEPGGAVLAAQVGLALLLTWWSRHRSRAPREILAALRGSLRQWPSAKSTPPALLLVFLVATLFMLNPAGLAATGDLLQATLTGLVAPGPDATGLTGAALWSTTGPAFVTPRLADFLARLQLVVVFEPLLVAAAGGYLLLRRVTGLSDVDRFLVFWLLTALLSLLLWRAAGPAHVLWLALPLAGLAAGLLTELLAGDEARNATPNRDVTLVAAFSFALLATLAFYVQLLLQNSAQPLTAFAGLALLPPFLMAGAWQRPWPPLVRAALLGAVLLALPLSLGGGWVTAVSQSETADGLWRRSATSQDVWLLLHSLRALEDRESGGFAGLEFAVLNDGASLPRWLLRDQVNMQLVNNVEDVGDAGILLLPGGAEAPGGVGAWVGQDFTIRRSIAVANEGWSAYDFQTAGNWPVNESTWVLWLREDLFAESRDNGDGQVSAP